MSATRERSGRLADAWNRAGGIAPAAGGLRRGVAASWASGRGHPRAALAAGLAALLLVLGCFWLWFKDSPLVSVNRVHVTGLSGPNVPQIRQALSTAAVRMTTLDVNMAALRAAVDRYPDVRSLTVDTQFPHGMVIHVLEQVPIAQVSLQGNSMAVSRDGTLLRPTAGSARLPALRVAGLPSGSGFTSSGALSTLAVLAAAPYRFLSHIQSAQETSGYGVVVQLRRGPQIRFGDVGQLHDKWSAALAVLAASSAQGAQYIDVTDPGRPAAGVTTSAANTSSSATSPTGSTTGGTGGPAGNSGSTAGAVGSTQPTAGSTGATPGGTTSSNATMNGPNGTG